MKKPPYRRPTAAPTAPADPTAFTEEEEAEVARVAERLVATGRYTAADPGSTAWFRAEHLVDTMRRTPPGWFDDPKPGDWPGPEVEVNVAYRPDAEPRTKPRSKPRRLVVDP